MLGTEPPVLPKQEKEEPKEDDRLTKYKKLMGDFVNSGPKLMRILDNIVCNSDEATVNELIMYQLYEEQLEAVGA